MDRRGQGVGGGVWSRMAGEQRGTGVAGAAGGNVEKEAGEEEEETAEEVQGDEAKGVMEGILLCCLPS